MNDIVLNNNLPNDSGPASTLIHDIGEDVTNENVMLQEQSELNSNASDLDDTALQEEHDDFGNLLMKWRCQCCPMETLRRGPSSSSCNVVTDRWTSYSH